MEALHLVDRARIDSAVMNPNGFVRLTLTPETIAARLEIHHWPHATAANTPHTHRRPFTSYVVRGDLIQTVYRQTSARGDAVRFVSECVHFDGTRYELIPAGTVFIEPESRDELTSGDSYRQRSNVFHSVETDGPTTTIVMEGALSSQSTYVVAEPLRTVRCGRPVDPLRAEEILAEVRDHLA